MQAQVLKGQTIQAFQKKYTELVETTHATEVNFIKEQLKYNDLDVYFSNPVRELHTFYKLKTYFCHYFLFCKLKAARDGVKFTAEYCKEKDVWASYVVALKDWGC